MANEVKITVIVNDGSKPGVTSVKAGMHDVETAADKAGMKVAAFGKQTQNVRDDLKRLDAGIAASKQSLSQLTSAFANTDDAAQRLDIKKAINKVQADLAASTKAKKFKLSELMDLEPDPASGKRWLNKFSDQIVSAAPSGMAPALAVLGAVMAPTLGATAAAAVIGGAGGLGIIGGILLAAKDKRVQTAGAEMGKSIMADLTDRGKVFVQPVLNSILLIKRGYASITPELSKTFEVLAKQVQPLTNSLIRGGQSMVRGWAEAAQNSGPVLESLGRLAESAGASIGKMFVTLSKRAPEAASAIDDLSSALNGSIEATTMFIDGLAQAKGWMDKFDGAVDSGRAHLEDWLSIDKIAGAQFDITADGYRRGSEAAMLYRDGVIGVKGAYNDYEAFLNDAAEGTFRMVEADNAAEKAAKGHRDALVDLSNEMKAQVDPVFGLLNASDKLSEAQGNYKEALKKGKKGTKEAEQALRDMAMAAIEMEQRTGQLGGTLDGKMSPALRSTLLAAGVTAKQIKGLEKQFAEARTEANRFAKKYTAAASVTGITSVVRSLHQVRDAAREIPRAIRIAMSITGSSSVSKTAHGIQKQYAHGGIIRGSADGGTGTGLTWVGENGPELADLSAGSRVWSAGDSRRMASQSTGDSGQFVMKVLPPDRSMEQSLMGILVQSLRLFVSNTSNGDVQVALGRSNGR